MTRQERLEALAREYPGEWTPDRDGCSTDELAEGQFAAVSRHDQEGWWISSFASFAEACKYMAHETFDGWWPAGVVDLDTGESIAVHTADPVITRSADQGGALAMPWDEPEEVAA